MAKKKRGIKKVSVWHDGPSTTTAEDQIVSPPKAPRNPCLNCQKMGFKCRAAGNEGEKRCQQCIDRGFTSCET